VSPVKRLSYSIKLTSASRISHVIEPPQKLSSTNPCSRVKLQLRTDMRLRRHRNFSDHQSTMSDIVAEPLFKGSTGRNTRGILRLTILCLIAAAAVASRLFSVIRKCASYPIQFRTPSLQEIRTLLQSRAFTYSESSLSFC
jgi:hypothetical protein